MYIKGTFGGSPLTGQTDDLLSTDANLYWAGFVSSDGKGDPHTFLVVGPGGTGPKRAPYARELSPALAFPSCNNLIRSAVAYPWHDAALVTPDFSNMIIYQLHVRTYNPSAPGAASTFLDVIGKIRTDFLKLGVEICAYNNHRSVPSFSALLVGF